jgi:D-alanine transaminase
MDGEWLYLNGEFGPLAEGRVPIEDRGFQLGDGVYEVIKVLNGHPVWLEDHLARLHHSLAEVRLSGVLEGHDLAAVLPELVRRSGLVDASIYVQVTRGVAPREFIFPNPPHPTVLAYARAKHFPQPQEILAGTTLHPVRDQRWARCDIKSTNLLASVLAKEEAFEAGADEALFVSPAGVVREGGSSNVLAVIDGVIRTHPLNRRILGGITRLHTLEIAHRLGYRVEERSFRLRDVIGPGSACSEFFTASTTKDLSPVVRIGDTAIGDGRPGPVTLALLEAMRAEQAALVGLPAPAALT